MDSSTGLFLETCIKYQLKNSVIADRIDQNRNRLVQLFLNIIQSPKIFQGGPKLLRKCTSKRDGKATLTFKISKTYQ